MKKSIIGYIMAFLMAGGAFGYTVIRDKDADIFETSIHEVVYVVDGDTLEIENDVRLRLIGIDSPERDECGYSASKTFLEDLVDGEQIRIEKDISGTDSYDRLLRYVYLPANEIEDDDMFVNEEIVRAGHARTLAIAPDNRYRDLLATAQDEAKRAKKGMWGECPDLIDESEYQEDSQPVDPSCTIKGNISAKSYGRNYFLVGCPNYNRVKIDLRRGEKYFCSEEEAKEAGFELSGSCISPL